MSKDSQLTVEALDFRNGGLTLVKLEATGTGVMEFSQNGGGPVRLDNAKWTLTRTVVNTGSYGATVADNIIAVQYGGPVNIGLPPADALGPGVVVPLTIVDERGLAPSNNIVVYPSGNNTILGQQYLVMNTRYEAANLYSDGVAAWFRL